MLMIRKTEEKDLAAVMDIIHEGTAYFARNGIPQWQNGYPNEETIREDIRNGHAFVLESDGAVIGTAAVIDARDPDYDYIENGSWLNEDDYIVIHRIALTPSSKGKGLAEEFLAFAAEEGIKKGIHNLRIDTHEKNSSMRSFLMKNGFTRCGNVYIGGTAPRIAYQKIID